MNAVDARAPEALHRACWHSRRTSAIPADLGFHTIENGELLFSAHPVGFPVVGHQFDVRNCGNCDYFRPYERLVRRVSSLASSAVIHY